MAVRGVRLALGLVGATAWAVVLAVTVTLQVVTDLPAPLELGEAGWYLDDAGPGEKTVEIRADGAWTTAPDETSPWVTVSPASGSGDGRITLRAAANGHASARWATISVTNAGSVSTVRVNQPGDGPAQAVPLSLGEDGWDVGPHSGTTTVPITSDREWTASSDQPWLTVTPTGSGALALSVAQNTGAHRSATVRVDDGTFVRVFVVNQAGAPRTPTVSLQVGGSRLEVDWDAGTTAVPVVADGPWTASSDEAWITASVSDGMVVLTWARNPGTAPRTGTIRVTSGGATRVVQVDQVGQTNQYAPEGDLDDVVLRPGQVRVRGRAVDRDQPATEVQVDVYVRVGSGDWTPVGGGTTDRADGDARGFDLAVPATLLDGASRYEVCAYARSVPAGADTGAFRLGCRTFASIAAVVPGPGGGLPDSPVTPP